VIEDSILEVLKQANKPRVLFLKRFNSFFHYIELFYLLMELLPLLSGSNRPFPYYLSPLSKSESWCPSLHMKVRFHSRAN